MKQHYRTGDQTLVREINLAIVFNQLWTNAPLSRAQLAKVTGLNKTTVSSLVHELLTKGFVREAGQRPSRGGRPATLIELNPQAACMIGVEIGVDYICAILTNFRAETEWRHYEPTGSHPSHQAIIERVKEIIGDAIKTADRLGLPLLGVGVGVPGLVDIDSGLLLFAPNLKWRDVPVRDMLASAFDFPILVDNEANLSALGEYYFGAARGTETFIYISVGVGLGGGVFLHGMPYLGASGYAGEFGHMAIVDDGLPCNCGSRGCWETVVSNRAVVNQARQATQTHPGSRLMEITQGQIDQITLPVVIRSAEEGDETAMEVLHKSGRYLGLGIANLINAYNPELVVLGGALSSAYPFMLPVVEKVVAERVIAVPAQSTPIVTSSHGEGACTLGAIASVLHKTITELKFAPNRSQV